MLFKHFWRNDDTHKQLILAEWFLCLRLVKDLPLYSTLFMYSLHGFDVEPQRGTSKPLLRKGKNVYVKKMSIHGVHWHNQITYHN